MHLFFFLISFNFVFIGSSPDVIGLCLSKITSTRSLPFEPMK